MIKVRTLKIKIQSYVRSATIVLLVQIILLFVPQEQPHSKRVDKVSKIAKIVKVDTIVLKEVFLSLSAPRVIIAL